MNNHTLLLRSCPLLCWEKDSFWEPVCSPCTAVSPVCTLCVTVYTLRWKGCYINCSQRWIAVTCRMLRTGYCNRHGLVPPPPHCPVLTPVVVGDDRWAEGMRDRGIRTANLWIWQLSLPLSTSALCIVNRVDTGQRRQRSHTRWDTIIIPQKDKTCTAYVSSICTVFVLFLSDLS